MKKTQPAADPQAYLAALGGWRHSCVEALREAVLASAPLEERIKWGHLVYFSHGPVLLIRAEDERVLLGFWRGQRLASIEPRLKGGGKYEMATVVLRAGESVRKPVVRKLVRAAVQWNASLGDPTRLGAGPRRGRRGERVV
jgi:hypothetical protein